MSRCVFVGEKRSARAIALNVTWLDGKLAAKTLHAALRAAGIDPAACLFVNLWIDGDGWVLNGEAFTVVRARAAEGVRVVGMGLRVQRLLRRSGVPFVAMVHPAARGAIRATARYQAHVADALAEVEAALAAGKGDADAS
jgi:hypothetical protein